MKLWILLLAALPLGAQTTVRLTLHEAVALALRQNPAITAAEHAIEILSRADRGRAMGKKARENAFHRYCASKIIPLYEGYYRRVLEAGAAASA